MVRHGGGVGGGDVGGAGVKEGGMWLTQGAWVSTFLVIFCVFISSINTLFFFLLGQPIRPAAPHALQFAGGSVNVRCCHSAGMERRKHDEEGEFRTVYYEFRTVYYVSWLLVTGGFVSSRGSVP